MPEAPDFLHDPRVQAFIHEVTRNVGASVTGLLNQTLQRMEQNLSPAGRVIEVVRRGVNQLPEKVQTTTPQLLAELNDNLMSLVTELRTANELADEQLDMASDTEPRRRRRVRR